MPHPPQRGWGIFMQNKQRMSGQNKKGLIEKWKAIPNFSRYEASNLGRIRSLNYKNTGKIRVLKLSLAPEGYLRTLLKCDIDDDYKCVIAEKIIMMTFNGPSQNPHKNYILHIDKDKSNNALSNLKLCDRTEKINHYRKK